MRSQWILILVLLISACSQNIDPADDYVKRLSNVLDVTSPAERISTPLFPRPRDLKIELEPSELSIREFLSLRECELHTTIAHRNSLLGKMASQSQLLFNDIRILEQGPACLKALSESTIGESILGNKLAEFLIKKAENLDQSLWRGLLAQSEHAKFWSLGDEHLSPSAGESLEALAAFVAHVQAGQFEFSDQQFDQVEEHLGKLRLASNGEVLQRYARLLSAMSQANSIVRQRLERPLCLRPQPTSKARHLANVVNKYFIVTVQRDAVELNRISEGIMLAHRKLESPLLAAANTNYQQWAKQRDSLIQLGKTATTTHAKLLQKLYQQCGLSVGIKAAA